MEELWQRLYNQGNREWTQIKSRQQKYVNLKDQIDNNPFEFWSTQKVATNRYRAKFIWSNIQSMKMLVVLLLCMTSRGGTYKWNGCSMTFCFSKEHINMHFIFFYLNPCHNMLLLTIIKWNMLIVNIFMYHLIMQDFAQSTEKC